MSVASSVKLKGIVEITLRDRRSGRVVDKREIHNRIVDYGLDLISRLMVSNFINNASEDFVTVPLQAIGVGTYDWVTNNGNDPTVDPSETELGVEVSRQPINSNVEILKAGLDLQDTNTNPVIRLTAKRHGAYGNRIAVQVPSPTQNETYSIRVKDYNATIWNGSEWIANPQAPNSFNYDYGNDDLAAFLGAINVNPVVEALLLAPAFTGDLASAAETNLSGGGGGVVVSATFSTSSGDMVLTEAGLFTDATPNSGVMFNMVRFPAITVSQNLDITFRWKLLFQEATGS